MKVRLSAANRQHDAVFGHAEQVLELAGVIVNKIKEAVNKVTFK